jgi:hypothetical protein
MFHQTWLSEGYPHQQYDTPSLPHFQGFLQSMWTTFVWFCLIRRVNPRFCVRGVLNCGESGMNPRKNPFINPWSLEKLLLDDDSLHYVEEAVAWLDDKDARVADLRWNRVGDAREHWEVEEYI